MAADAEILRRIREGDKGQFESLFRSSYISLVRYAKVLIKDHDSAEEIVQDLFVRLWEDRKKLNIENTITGYLFRSVHNRCLHHIEHLKVVERHSAEMLMRQPETQESPAEIMQYAELQIRISRILGKLPERCGQVFYMNRFEGLKYAEIAEKLSVSIKTVESDMGKALKEFRKELAEK